MIIECTPLEIAGNTICTFEWYVYIKRRSSSYRELRKGHIRHCLRESTHLMHGQGSRLALSSIVLTVSTGDTITTIVG